MLRFHRQNGFVILIVLVFMQILILLNWYVINNVLLLTRFSKNMAVHDLLYHQAKCVLTRVEAEVVSNLPDCLISFTDTDLLIAQPLTWWKAQSCSGNSQTFKYYYVVEPLAVDSCAIVDPVKKTIASWFRLTLFLYLNKGNARIFLQSTLVRPSTGGAEQPCTGSHHTVQVGRQSSRELDY